MVNLKDGRVYKLTKDNLSRTPNVAGNYTLYNKNKRPVYVGTTKGGTLVHISKRMTIENTQQKNHLMPSTTSLQK